MDFRGEVSSPWDLFRSKLNVKFTFSTHPFREITVLKTLCFVGIIFKNAVELSMHLGCLLYSCVHSVCSIFAETLRSHPVAHFQLFNERGLEFISVVQVLGNFSKSTASNKVNLKFDILLALEGSHPEPLP